MNESNREDGRLGPVFVSHAHEDRATAMRIVSWLERHGVSCWVAPRDVLAGDRYGDSLMNAIGECRALLLLLSRAANESAFVAREVERGVSRDKVVLPIRIEEDVLPRGALELYASSSQWVDAWEEPFERSLSPLVSVLAGSNRATALTSRRQQPAWVARWALPAVALLLAVIVALRITRSARWENLLRRIRSSRCRVRPWPKAGRGRYWEEPEHTRGR